MMRLSTMWRIDSTVAADGDSPVAERILEHWEHEQGSLQFFRSSANFLYSFRNGGRRYFLRFADGAERTRGAIEAEVEILGRLAGAGVEIADPVRSRHGRYVETTATDLGTFHAVVFAGLEGVQFDAGDLDASRFRAWGAALGKLHMGMLGYAGPGRAARGTWRDHLASARAHIPADASGVRRELDRVAVVLGALPANDDTYGLIHFDFELDNLVWRDHTVAILDFDDCARSWYAADIAFALRDLFDAGAGLADTRVREFVRGYRAHRPLDEDSLAQVPLFSRLARLLTYARLARAVDLDDDPAYPEWLRALGQKLRDRMEDYSASLGGRSR